MKRLCCLCLIFTLFLSIFGIVPASAATVVAKGIDVSQWQGNYINWNAVKNSGHGDFAILRAFCWGKDSAFDINYANAKAAGVPIGVYVYIYGTDASTVQWEINELLNVISGKQFEYPIYIDVEHQDNYAPLGRQATTDLVKMACQMLQNAGYFAGVYTYTSFANNYIYMNQLTAYTTWIAEYNYTCNYTGSYAMWQYGCEGSVGGISPVDVNYCYTDFPTIMKTAGLNGFTASGTQDPETPDDTKTIVAKGIDVSKWQMPVDWNAVAANPDIDYAIIRVTWSGLETTEWATFYAGAKAAGVPIGAYAYTMAATVAEAKAEAQKTVELLKGKKFEYPIYIDTEEGDIYNNMDKATLTAIVKAECDVLRDAGYMAGVYTNTWYATSKLDMAALSEYTVWLADYSSSPGYTGDFDMWQYTAQGVVNGVSGTVDMNYCYKDFPTIIKQKGLNGYTAQPQDTNIVAKGIDVSKWQMPVDWNAVAKDPNVDYAIIRVTWSGLETTEWATFYPEAKAAGVPIGCYAYTMAATVEDAVKEAQATVALLEGKQFEYPIYIDAEEPSVYDGMDKATLTAIVKAECDVLRDAGYMAGVYANSWYATSKLDMEALSEYTLWLADYNATPGYTGAYDMWQYSCTGTVNGISGDVDVNYCYTDFPTMIKAAGLNGYEAQQPEEESAVVAKGIDISYWQGTNIDWNAVKASGHGDFAILRAYSYGQDANFETNYANATAAGVDVGAYIYLYGTTTEAVTQEINALLAMLKGKKFGYPIYVTMDSADTYQGFTVDFNTSLVTTACSLLEANNYVAGLCTTTAFANAYLDMDQLAVYTTWIMDYSSSPGFTGNYAMWQYGCEGSVGGINPVCVNYSYMNWPAIMEETGLNGFGTEQPETPEEPEVSQYVLKLNANGAQGAMDDITVLENQTVVVPVCTFVYENYEFTGWNTNADGTGTAYAAGDKLTLSDNVVLYAIWQAVEPEEPEIPQEPEVQPDALFCVDNVTAKIGNTFTVAVRLEKNPGIVSAKVKVGFDSNVLEVVSLAEGDYAGVSFSPVTNNPLVLNWVDSLNGNNTTNGVLGYITFQVKEGATVGDTAITLTHNKNDVFDFDFNNVAFGVQNGVVTVVDYVSGDLNDDGEIDNKDLSEMMRYLNDWGNGINEDAADVNRDGEIDNKDYGILQRYLNGWNVALA